MWLSWRRISYSLRFDSMKKFKTNEDRTDLSGEVIIGIDGEGSPAAFDPATELFVAQSRRPAELSDINFADLSPLLRVLLVTDGTVTKLLEAYALEPVTVRRLDQYTKCLDAADDYLGLEAGEELLVRSVMLVGTESQRLYVFAESLIAPGNLPVPIRERLQTETGGLGKILLDSGLETRREGLWYGKERPVGVPESVASLCAGDFITRSYRIISGGLPLMLITERFPEQLRDAVTEGPAGTA
jgi:chorismate-pyruvate lyase